MSSETQQPGIADESDNRSANSGPRAQRAFLIVVGILLVSAVSLNATIQKMKLHFKKQPVDILVYGKALEELPKDIGPWHMVNPGDERLNEDVEHALGTHEYVFRQYLDERVLGKAVVESIKEMNDAQRREAVFRYQMANPAAVVNLALTYYTGLVDTVAHVPDRCYIADGYQPTSHSDLSWGPADHKVPVRYINFEDQTGVGKLAKNVAYFFQVNGEYKSDPIGVRIALQNLVERYGYYAKVELMTQRLGPNEAAPVMNDFLTYALPEIEKCLPDWQRVRAAEAAASK